MLNLRTLLYFLTLPGLLLLMNCAVFTSLSTASDSVSTALGGASESLESISTSVQSISSSITSSSGDDDEEEREEDESYRRDVRNYTASFLQRGQQTPVQPGNHQHTEYTRNIQRIAGLHGIMDWQSLPATYQAIGAGLRMAGVDSANLQNYFRNVAPAARKHIERGFAGT